MAEPENEEITELERDIEETRIALRNARRMLREATIQQNTENIQNFQFMVNELEEILESQLEEQQQVGEGFLLRNEGTLPPDVRKMLEQIGNEEIKSIKIVRTPLSSFTKGFLNVISLGQFDKISRQYYDNIFHLSMWINGSYNLEKNAVISLSRKSPIESNSEVKDVTNIPSGLTIQTLLDKTKQRMGSANYTNYDADKNNCQNFLLNILEANKIGDESDRTFTKQNTKEIFEKLPAFSKVLGNLATKAGAVWDRLLKGEGSQTGGEGHDGDECQCGEGFLDFLRTDKQKEASKKKLQDYTLGYLTRQGDTAALEAYKKQQGLGSDLYNYQLHPAKCKF